MKLQNACRLIANDFWTAAWPQRKQTLSMSQRMPVCTHSLGRIAKSARYCFVMCIIEVLECTSPTGPSTWSSFPAPVKQPLLSYSFAASSGSNSWNHLNPISIIRSSYSISPIFTMRNPEGLAAFSQTCPEACAACSSRGKQLQPAVIQSLPQGFHVYVKRRFPRQHYILTPSCCPSRWMVSNTIICCMPLYLNYLNWKDER